MDLTAHMLKEVCHNVIKEQLSPQQLASFTADASDDARMDANARVFCMKDERPSLILAHGPVSPRIIIITGGGSQTQ